jgi:hypothetical protein
MNRSVVALSLATLFVIALPMASAQTNENSVYIPPITDDTQPVPGGDSFKSLDHTRHHRFSRVEQPAGASSDAGLTVSFDPEISRAIRAEYIAAIERTSGSRAALGLDDYYAENDVLAQLRTALAPYDLRVDDFGDVTTAWLVVMWSIANQAPLPSADVVRGVRAQTRAALLDEGRVPARAAERQRALEMLAYQTMTLMHARDSAEASGNETFLAELADSAQASMKRNKFNLRAMAPTQAGMLRR